MTETYKVGEYVKIVRTDEGYNEELGDQTGLVGTVKSGGQSVYVTFPHTGDKQFYYMYDEIVRAPGTTPLPEPLKIGDWVKVVNHTTTWDGTVGKIRKFYSDKSVEIVNDVHTLGLGFEPKNLELTVKPTPKPKFVVGDWVEVTGYANVWNGTKGEVTIVGDYERSRDSFSVVIRTADGKPSRSGGFDEKYLKVTTKPYVPKYAVGDWVEVQGCCSMPTCNGTKWQVKELPTSSSGYYVLENGDREANYSQNYLKAAEAPHWTKTKPVGSTAQVTYSGGGTNRVLTKISEDEWLHIYQDGDGKATFTANRSSERTRTLFGYTRNIQWATAEV